MTYREYSELMFLVQRESEDRRMFQSLVSNHMSDVKELLSKCRDDGFLKPLIFSLSLSLVLADVQVSATGTKCKASIPLPKSHNPAA